MEFMELSPPVIAILRGIDSDFFSQVMAAGFANGLQAIEVTMNTAGAEEIVSRNRAQVPEGKYLGMGTVCDLDDAQKAIAAGAMFLVTPNFDQDVINYAHSQHVFVVAGALTPTEIYSARRAGADMVKVFPCRALGGPKYISELRGPFNDIPLVAVGGVTHENMDEYFKAGVFAVGVSSSIFGKRALKEKNIMELTENVKKFMRYFK